MKGVYYALVLMVRNPRKISKQIKNQATVDAPLVVLCTAGIVPDSHWCTPTPMAMQVACWYATIPLQRGVLTLLVSICKAIS